MWALLKAKIVIYNKDKYVYKISLKFIMPLICVIYFYFL